MEYFLHLNTVYQVPSICYFTHGMICNTDIMILPQPQHMPSFVLVTGKHCSTKVPV